MYIVEGTIPLREKEHIREMCICNDGESVNQKQISGTKDQKHQKLNYKRLQN